MLREETLIERALRLESETRLRASEQLVRSLQVRLGLSLSLRLKGLYPYIVDISVAFEWCIGNSLSSSITSFSSTSIAHSHSTNIHPRIKISILVQNTARASDIVHRRLK